MAKVDPGLNSLLKIHMDGIPLPLARRLVPLRKLLTFGLFIHFFYHANSQQKYADKGETLRDLKRLSPGQMLNLAFSLRDTIDGIRWQPKGTEWIDYYNDTNYSDTSMNNKIEMVKGYFEKIPRPRMVWDLGGNTGFISRAVQEYADHIICFDVDVAAVEKNYLQVKENRETKILPLVMDFNNPSSSIGFASRERFSLKGRGRADLGLVLALIHHLAISNNIPFSYLAEYFSSLCNYLIIEFVPKEDSQVQRLLLSREDIFPEYNIENFEKEFSRYFNIIAAKKVSDSERTLFLMGIS
jgi:ribosomal protein L11 methylase PrmA